MTMLLLRSPKSCVFTLWLAVAAAGLTGCAEDGPAAGHKGAKDPSSEDSSDDSSSDAPKKSAKKSDDSDSDSDKGDKGGGLVGNPAPAFSVAKAPGTKGSKGKISLASLAGNVVLVDFWGTFCEPCKKSFPKLQELSAKYGGSGLKIVGISEDEPEDKDKIADFVQSYGAKFAIGWDEDKSVARHYKPETMPTSFLVDRKGIVRFTHVGYHDGEEVGIEKEVKTLLAE